MNISIFSTKDYENISDWTIGENQKVTAKLDNVSDKIAFFIELRVSGKKSGETILPIFWEDNYISLLPGESRNIEAVFAVIKDEPVFTINGWNLEANWV